MLSFELGDSDEELLIHADEAGIESLVGTLQRLCDSTEPGEFNHDHLHHPDWAGYELSEESKGGRVVKHVKVYCWKGDVPAHRR